MYNTLLSYLPQVEDPKTRLTFKMRLKWTGVVLLLFLVLGQITVYGASEKAYEQFAFFELILGSSLGSIITLGIGPIVTASIILQLLVGSKIINWDLRTKEGKARFQGTQKLMAIFFAIFEAFAYVSFGAIQPVSNDPFIFGFLIAQLTLGGIIIMLMDEVVSKWGIGSGISLFIAAGVSKTIFIRAFNPFPSVEGDVPVGLIPFFAYSLQLGQVSQAMISLLPIISTIMVFLIVVYVQSINVEVPLAFASIRGFARRWPLKFIYTSNIPVILIAALLANIQLMGSMTATPQPGSSLRCGLFGCFENRAPVSGLAFYLSVPNSVPIQIFMTLLLVILFGIAFLCWHFKFEKTEKIILISGIVGFFVSLFITLSFVGLPSFQDTLRMITYLSFLSFGSMVFSIFWVNTSGMDARTVAQQIQSLGMQIPGFRRDPRIIEQVLDRYIPILAVLGGLFVGLLAAVADFTNALGTGTGILLTVMIIHNLYEQISMHYMEDMHPALRKFLGR